MFKSATSGQSAPRTDTRRTRLTWPHSTFLPQDRVAEFARMTPQELLKQTQLAAGNEHLTAWHQTLISSGKELRREQEVSLALGSDLLDNNSRFQLVDADKDQLKTMEDRNANLERDVRRYEERRALEQQVHIVCLCSLWDTNTTYRSNFWSSSCPSRSTMKLARSTAL